MIRFKLKYMLRMRWMFKVNGLARGRGCKGRRGAARHFFGMVAVDYWCE